MGSRVYEAQLVMDKTAAGVYGREQAVLEMDNPRESPSPGLREKASNLVCRCKPKLQVTRGSRARRQRGVGQLLE